MQTIKTHSEHNAIQVYKVYKLVSYDFRITFLCHYFAVRAQTDDVQYMGNGLGSFMLCKKA